MPWGPSPTRGLGKSGTRSPPTRGPPAAGQTAQLDPGRHQDRSYRTRPFRCGASVRAQTEGQALFSAERSLSSISHAWSSVWKAECRMRNGSVHDRMRFATSPAL